ncbi:MAG TPA: primosomal protein N', partial [Chloroflexia bacterium]|nr:primosomal protein N' [Chloroflexia bacterium]
VVTLHLTAAGREALAAPGARLTARQSKLLHLLDGADGVLSSDALRARLGGSDPSAVARQLERRGLVERRSSLVRPRVGPRHELFVRLVQETPDRPARPSRLGAVQAATLDWLATSPSNGAAEGATDGWRPARALYSAVGGSGRHTLATLARHGLVVTEERVLWRDPLGGARPPLYAPLLLTARQGQVWEALAGALETRRTRRAEDPAQCYLLHGVTGSGKTEIYLRAIGMALRLGQQAIVLVPEIALTPQTMHRFAGRFPGRVALLHSGLSAGERYDQWRQVRDGGFDVVVGSRSAVFAPLPRLGLVILDEEHEWSYKQESNPRFGATPYHARDVALRRAALTGAVVVLGSATPEVATYYRATKPSPVAEPVSSVDWHLLSLPARVGVARGPDGAETTTELPMPPVRLVDMRQELRGGNRSIFSQALQRALARTLAAGEQAILFLNRRGSRTFIICRACGYVPTCPQCDIPLVYHADIDLLLCHRCDTRTRQPHPCPQCGSEQIKRFGAGTQRVEEEMRALFPDARVLRWDRDTAARKGAHDSMLGAFMRQEADVLVGTQMIAKGLDLPLVTLVGVISADTGLHLPDFRAGERTFQLLTQVAGRAGRRTAGGQVIVQTYSPEHYAIQAAARHDYRSFYTQDLRFRLVHDYPPFSRMAKLVYSAYSEAACQIEANRLSAAIRDLAADLQQDAVEVLGPAPAFVHKLRNRYRWQILLRGTDLAPLLAALTLPPDWTLDVDPVSML